MTYGIVCVAKKTRLPIYNNPVGDVDYRVGIKKERSADMPRYEMASSSSSADTHFAVFRLLAPHLDLGSLARLACTCRDLHRAYNEDVHLFARALLREYPDSCFTRVGTIPTKDKAEPLLLTLLHILGTERLLQRRNLSVATAHRSKNYTPDSALHAAI